MKSAQTYRVTKDGCTHLEASYKSVNGRELMLDLFLPVNPCPVPVIIAIHGGGWSFGSKRDYSPDAFLENGYAMASIEYRLSPHDVFPAQMEDVTAAVRWLRARAEELGLDSGRFGAFGHSAGGHLAALLGVTANRTDFEAGDNPGVSSEVHAVVDFAGPADFSVLFDAQCAPVEGDSSVPATWVKAGIRLLGGEPIGPKRELAERASPVRHIRQGCPPFLLIHGEKDELVDADQSRRMYNALRRYDVPAELILLPDADHGMRMNMPYGNGVLWDVVFRFFDSVLKKKETEATSS
ncbi:MAG: alpha/beta fold hydrolase [Candidatus Methylacidiphilales bacterium]|nr:alpha/beta hydrolase [Candidatus Methylacidiphilales bacterium]